MKREEFLRRAPEIAKAVGYTKVRVVDEIGTLGVWGTSGGKEYELSMVAHSDELREAGRAHIIAALAREEGSAG